MVAAIRKAKNGISPAACQAFIATARAADAIEDIHDLCGELCEVAGFDYYVYGAKFPVSFVHPETFVVSGLPQRWWDRYCERNYLAVDPVLHQATTRCTTPILWDEIRPEHGPEPVRVRPFMEEARSFGLVSGVSFPLQGRSGETAILSLASRGTHAQIQGRIVRTLPAGQLLAGFIHEAGRRIAVAEGPGAGRAELTPRERECLLWAAEGHTTHDTARRLELSERTVVFHLHNAARKLGVRNRAQAVARAIAEAHILPQHRS